MDNLDDETEMSRTEAATFLREIADKLEGKWDSTEGRTEETTVIGGDDEVRTGRDDATTSGTARPETMTVIGGGESATVVLPERLALDVEIGSRSGLVESGVDQRMAFEFVWQAEEIPEDDSIELV